MYRICITYFIFFTENLRFSKFTIFEIYEKRSFVICSHAFEIKIFSASLHFSVMFYRESDQIWDMKWSPNKGQPWLVYVWTNEDNYKMNGIGELRALERRTTYWRSRSSYALLSCNFLKHLYFKNRGNNRKMWTFI